MKEFLKAWCYAPTAGRSCSLRVGRRRLRSLALSYRLVQLKFYFSSKRETVTGLGIFFLQMIVCFSSSFF